METTAIMQRNHTCHKVNALSLPAAEKPLTNPPATLWLCWPPTCHLLMLHSY